MQNNAKPVWQPPQKPGEISEARLIHAILDGTFPINSHLPAERELAMLLGITRPTLREALQRLERDGWLEIQHGKPTRVRDFWREGRLGVSLALAQHQDPLPADYVSNLLAVRVLLAPDYTRGAVEQGADQISQFLGKTDELADAAPDYARFDWLLHWQLTILSGNPFYTHFINSVQQLYELLGVRYFTHSRTRAHSRDFYVELRSTAQRHDAHAAEILARRVMQESRDLWLELLAK